MDLQGHPRLQLPPVHLPLHVDHRQLGDVGRRALHRHVYRHALRRRPDLAVGGVDLRYVPSSAQDGLNVAPLPGLPLGRLKVLPDPGVLVEIGVDEGRRLLAGKLGGLLQPVAAHPVDDAEVDRLGHPPHVGRHFGQGNAEHLRCGRAVDVLVVAEGGQQRGVLRQVGQHPQVDLGVVRRQKHAALAGDKGLPHLPSQLASHRDILQVGVAGGQPPGGGARLVEAGVYPPRLRIDQRRKGIDVGRFELGELAVLQKQLDNGVSAAESLQHGRIGGVAALGPPPSGQSQLLEEHQTQLLG